LIKACKKYLAFDDRLLMLWGTPIFGMLIPLMLDIKAAQPHSSDYWSCHVPHSTVFVIVYWFFYRWMVIFLRGRFPSFKDTFKRNVIQYSIVLVSVPIIKVVLSYTVDEVVARALGSPAHEIPLNAQNALAIYLPSILIIVIYEAVYFFVQYKEAMIAKERLEKSHIETQLVHLRNQINPHFLFNSLNVLCNLIPKEPDLAMTYLNKLSKFYRYTVDVKGEKLIPLSEEMKRAKLYGELLSVRFRDALTIQYEHIDSLVAKIPSLSLQLLIENAIKHNIVSNEDPLNIDVRLTEDGKYIQVCNNLQLKMQEVESTGIGLKNIKKRIAFFTEEKLLVTESDSEFCVKLPLIF
jgi:two-component system LytT family sensor kinase